MLTRMIGQLSNHVREDGAVYVNENVNEYEYGNECGETERPNTPVHLTAAGDR